MKVCLVGSLVSFAAFDEIVKKSKSKPSNAPENFQMMLAKGFVQNGVDVTALSFPTMASFPNGAALICHPTTEKIMDGVVAHHQFMINAQGFKQLTIFVSTFLSVRRWLKKNQNEKLIVALYSDYPPYATAARLACKKNRVKTVLVMTDLPTYKSSHHSMSPYTLFMNAMDTRREKNYRKFDGYIVLTKHMISAMEIGDKPCVVVEGFSDPSAFEGIETHKEARKTIMYAGALSNVHNIKKLIDGFMATDIDADLLIFGDGDQREYVQEATKRDARIKYRGKVNRNELLQAQKNSHVLVSVKSTEDEHTLYAFPSKILEYLTSGTAVLTTKVGGIPDAYFDCMYTIDDESIEGIAAAITRCLQVSEECLVQMGEKGYRFASEYKNTMVQGKCIVDFLETI